MALEKERLMAYFQEHYLSRQEVLYKLPLSLSIDAFWPELLNRRKATAAVLPLYNAAGMPYWYVQTQRMVHASEQLCEAAMAQADGFDPYRAQMTSAMTEEMFFTSFVEGAQIPLQEAMDFLQRGTEPENIQEQMIWNNRCAWQAMISALYRPLDEPFVRSLAWALTQEMDNAAEDYRQTDSHPIAAMSDERYSVPSAISLPDRMREYRTFVYLNLWSDIDPTDMANRIRTAMYSYGFAMVEESDKGYNQPAYDTATSQFTVQWTWCWREEVERLAPGDAGL